MHIEFVPHRLSILGYSRLFFRRRIGYLVLFPLSLAIILLLIFILNSGFWDNPNEWLVEISNTDLLVLFRTSFIRFFNSVLNSVVFIALFYLGSILGYFLSRMLVSLAFTVFRLTNRKLYYLVKPVDKPLPKGFGYKLPQSNFVNLIILAYVFSLSLNFFLLQILSDDLYRSFLTIVVILTSIFFSFIDYSHILIIFGENEVIYTSKTFGKSFLAPRGKFVAPTTKFEKNKKGISKKAYGTAGTNCPKCSAPLYGYGVVQCPNCNSNLKNILCPICRENFTAVDEKALCPECLVMFHHTHLLNYVAIFKKCPNCQKLLDYDVIENFREISPLK